MLRLTTGFCRGMDLAVPTGDAVRPTSAKVRQAMWNSLQQAADDALVLDLCAGSGAVGIEGLARGARGAVFVEVSGKVFPLLETNLKEVMRRANREGLNLSPVIALRGDLEKVWERIRGMGPFDIVWSDPPYADAADRLQWIWQHLDDVTHAGSWFIFEAGPQVTASDFSAKPGWQLAREKEYGDTKLWFWHRAEEATA